MKTGDIFIGCRCLFVNVLKVIFPIHAVSPRDSKVVTASPVTGTLVDCIGRCIEVIGGSTPIILVRAVELYWILECWPL
jgi:hypothetical protein